MHGPRIDEMVKVRGGIKIEPFATVDGDGVPGAV
jgi:hypothetical protein